MYIILTHLGFVCIYAGTKWESLELEMTTALGSLTLILFSGSTGSVDSISWDKSLHQSYEVLCEPKRKTKNTLPLQLRVSYIVIKCMHILFYLLLLETRFI